MLLSTGYICLNEAQNINTIEMQQHNSVTLAMKGEIMVSSIITTNVPLAQPRHSGRDGMVMFDAYRFLE